MIRTLHVEEKLVQKSIWAGTYCERRKKILKNPHHD
jgi:hypothetical protein